MFSLDYILIMGSVCVIATGQIAMKFASKALVFEDGQTFVTLLRLNIFPIAIVCVAMCLYFVSTFAWVYALRTVPLSVAYMFNSLAFVLVPIAGFILFSEALPRFFVPGLALILIGILLVSRG